MNTNIRAACFVVVVIGLITFFLPLVRVQAPFLGTQRISGWDAVKPSDERSRDNDLGLRDSLGKMRRDILRQKSRETPVAIEQAQSLVVTLPLAYISLLAGGIFLFLRKSKGLQIAAGIGVLACVWSFVSIAWLSSGVKEMVAGAGGGRAPILGRILSQSVAENTSVGPELGLYLLAGSVVALLAAGFLRGK